MWYRIISRKAIPIFIKFSNTLKSYFKANLKVIICILIILTVMCLITYLHVPPFTILRVLSLLVIIFSGYFVYKYPEKLRLYMKNLHYTNLIQTNIFLILLQLITANFPFVVFYSITKNGTTDLYWFNWMLNHKYLHLWVLISILILLKQYKFAMLLSLGNAGGIILGQYLGDIIKEMKMSAVTNSTPSDKISAAHNHPAFEIWIITMVVATLIFIFTKTINNFKRSNKDEKN